VHHTEYTMPAGGILFANDHDAGRTFLFDLRDPLHPRIAGSFTDVDGYMHPHSPTCACRIRTSSALSSTATTAEASSS
jgi:hypothetical protein